MFIVRGRLLGTTLALLIAALGAALVSRSPVTDDSGAGCDAQPAAVATVAAVARR
jgi:hypothetical protein